MTQIANTPDGMWKTNGKEATELLVGYYRSLSTAAQKIMQQAKLSGRPIPCDVIDNYNKAVNEYLSYGNRLFDLFHKNKLTIEQVVYSGGKPAVDAHGNIRTLRINAPLRPPTFVLTKTECPGITKVTVSGDPRSSELGHSEMGIPLVAAAVYIVGGLLFFGVAGPIFLDKLTLLIRGPIVTPKQAVDAYTKCLDGVEKHVKDTYKNIPADEQNRIAAQLAMPCAEKSKGQSGSSVPMVALGLAGATVAGIYFWKKGS